MRIALIQAAVLHQSGCATTLMGALNDFLKQQGHRVLPISLPANSSMFPLFESSLGETIDRLRRYRPDVVLEQCMSYSIFSRINQVVKSMSIPVISIMESLSIGHSDRSSWLKTPRRRLESDFFESVDALVFTSRKSRDEALEKHAQIRRAILAYPAGNHFAGVERPEQIVERARRCGPLQLLFRGDVLPGSGLIGLIDSLQTIPEGSWQLHVIGDFQANRSYTKRVLRTIRRKGLEGWVDLEGPMEAEALQRAYADSHAVFVPFSSDRYEVAVVEAMGYGLPAFCPATGACRELVQDGINGFLISPSDCERAAREIARLYEDRDQLTVMGLAAWSASQQHPKWADSLGAIEDLLFQEQLARELQPLPPSSTYRRNMVMLEN